MHNFNENDIKTFDNVFSEVEMHSIIKYLERPMWRYGHVSSTKDKRYMNCPPFWSMTLVKDEFFTEHLLNKILEVTGDDLILETVYANGQTYGIGGQPHEDSVDEYGRTFLLYANTGWDVRWNGKTTFMFQDKSIHVQPAYNKAVYFPGIIKHFAEETTRTFGGLRTTVAWKLRLK